MLLNWVRTSLCIAIICESVATGSAKELDELAANKVINQSPVRVAVREIEFTQKSGTGVILSQSGIVLTCKSILEDSKVGFIELNGNRERIPFKVIYTDPRADVALLLTDKPLTDVEVPLIAPHSSLTQGELLRCRPQFNMGPICTTEGILMLEPSPELSFTFVAQFPCTPGATGAPIFDSEAHLVGIVLGPVNPNVLFITRGLDCDQIVSHTIETAFGDKLNTYLGGLVLSDSCVVTKSTVSTINENDRIVEIENAPIRNRSDLLLALAAVANRSATSPKVGFDRAGKVGHMTLPIKVEK